MIAASTPKASGATSRASTSSETKLIARAATNATVDQAMPCPVERAHAR